MEQELSYKNAQDELEQILNELESGNADIDELTVKVQRACQLIQYCRQKLRTTDEEVKEILKSFDIKTDGEA